MNDDDIIYYLFKWVNVNSNYLFNFLVTIISFYK